MVESVAVRGNCSKLNSRDYQKDNDMEVTKVVQTVKTIADEPSVT
ncbi:hypothetical protein M2350_003664 [Candidatus Fervidibacter sacchari]|uniref:Uncharacterized protein n=1 Tax=Candidatus Fervidibacter sacchari TaxID=1448929 RepID=A0ABT2ETC5_9BACT|nr:hypothetical protein [Candidatus Fervidibacter sacchari]